MIYVYKSVQIDTHSCSYQCLLKVQLTFCNKQSEITYCGKNTCRKMVLCFGDTFKDPYKLLNNT